jgi:hypothetical protein
MESVGGSVRLPERRLRSRSSDEYGAHHSRASRLTPCVMSAIVLVHSRLGLQRIPRFNSLHLTDISLTGLCSLPWALGPTLILEPCDDDIKGLRKLLHVTRCREGQIAVKGRVMKASCPVILCVEEPLEAALPDWLAVTIPVPAAVQPLPTLDAHTLDQIAEEFQGKLLLYRLQNARKVRASTFDLPELGLRFRDPARCLGACVADAAELQKLVGQLFREQKTEMQTGEDAELNSAVIEALLNLCHNPGKQTLAVAEIATAANKILERRGETIQLQPRPLGDRLRHLEFDTHRLGSRARGFNLVNSTRKCIHDLAMTHQLLGAANQSVDCRVCTTMFPNEEEKGRRERPHRPRRQNQRRRARTKVRGTTKLETRMHVVYVVHVMYVVHVSNVRST